MEGVRQKLSKSDIILLILVVLYVGLWPLASASSLVVVFRGVIQGLIYILGGLVLLRWVIVAVRWAVRRFLWRVRHRMVAVFFFVGALPLALGGLMVILGAMLLFGSLTSYLVDTQVGLRAMQLQAEAGALLSRLRTSSPENHADILDGFIGTAGRRFPALTVHAEVGGRSWTLPEEPEPLVIPDELARHSGPVLRGSDSFLPALVEDAESGDRVLVLVPMTPEFVRRMLPGLGILSASVDDSEAGFIRSVLRQLAEARDGRADPIIGELPAPAHPFDWRIRWPVRSAVLVWERNQVLSGSFLLETRPSAILRMVFATQAESLNAFAVGAGYSLLSAFLIVVVTSLFAAVSLTRTLTRAVNELYVGTQHVNAGNFEYRVPITGSDQISDLSLSFNTMTESIERLIEDSKERERLEAELDIAHEVQSKLFPPQPPQIETLELLGVCRPARSVSGDFFDYVKLSDSRFAISFGDVSGKGISAALVMATLHSTVRTQLSLLTQIDSRQLDRAVAEVVDRTNKHLCEATAADKFSTLFFSAYDEETGQLSSTNAGHLPPLLIRRGEVMPLDIHGMVVGAFAVATYEHGVVDLEQGDLLVAFTDGITEPENAYEEEFGEQRLIELLLRDADRPIEEIISTVMTEVVEWTGDTALQDDMTMLVARRL